MPFKHFAIGTLLCAAGMACQVSHADTMKLVSATGPYETIDTPNGQGTGSGTEDAGIFPYNFSIDGSSTLTPLMCITLNDDVSVGETWTVTEQVLTTTSNVDYLADAWIFSQQGQSYEGTPYSTSEIQFAVWDILDPNDTARDSEFDAAAQYLATQGLKEATTSGDLSASFLSQFTVYIPNPDTPPSGYSSAPQFYIGEVPITPTPEPSSLLLLGTGLLSAAVLIMRKRTKPLLSDI